MLSRTITTWAQTPWIRRAVCVLLMPLVLLSGLALDVRVTHADCTGREHIHVSRVLDPKDAPACHHPDAGCEKPADQPSTDTHDEPECCCITTESTVEGNGDHHIRGQKESDGLLLHALVAVISDAMSVSLFAVDEPQHPTPPPLRAPGSVNVLRTTVLLI